jgi:hypothetical protein
MINGMGISAGRYGTGGALAASLGVSGGLSATVVAYVVQLKRLDGSSFAFRMFIGWRLSVRGCGRAVANREEEFVGASSCRLSARGCG